MRVMQCNNAMQGKALLDCNSMHVARREVVLLTDSAQGVTIHNGINLPLT